MPTVRRSATRGRRTVNYRSLNDGRASDAPNEPPKDRQQQEETLRSSLDNLSSESKDLQREQERINLLLTVEKQRAELKRTQEELKALRASNDAPAAPHNPVDIQQAGDIGLLNDLIDLRQEQTSTQSPAPPRVDHDPRAYLGLHTTRRGKYKAVVDYIPRSATQSNEEIDLGGGFVLTNRQGTRPKLESVTAAQWTVANMRIMAEIVRDDSPRNPNVNYEYMAHTAKIGELATRFTWTSVIAYDDAYRQCQHENGFKWGSDAPHTCIVLLREPQHRQLNQRQQKPASAPDQQQQYCHNYNNGRVCTFGENCRFRHKCEICNEDHAKANHKDKTQ